MRHATRLVTEGSMRVGEVASAVDPASQPRLAKVFRTRFGASPLVCRRMKAAAAIPAQNEMGSLIGFLPDTDFDTSGLAFTTVPQTPPPRGAMPRIASYPRVPVGRWYMIAAQKQSERRP